MVVVAMQIEGFVFQPQYKLRHGSDVIFPETPCSSTHRCASSKNNVSSHVWAVHDTISCTAQQPSYHGRHQGRASPPTDQLLIVTPNSSRARDPSAIARHPARTPRPCPNLSSRCSFPSRYSRTVGPIQNRSPNQAKQVRYSPMHEAANKGAIQLPPSCCRQAILGRWSNRSRNQSQHANSCPTDLDVMADTKLPSSSAGALCVHTVLTVSVTTTVEFSAPSGIRA